MIHRRFPFWELAVNFLSHIQEYCAHLFKESALRLLNNCPHFYMAYDQTDEKSPDFL